MAATDFLTEEQLQAMMEQRFGVPEGTARSSPLDFQYQNEEYPNSYGKSELYYDRQGPFSDKRQVADPDAYYNQVRTIGTPGNPFMGARDDTDASFAKRSGDYYAGDYVNYDETTDRPYQGDRRWQKGYEPDDLKGLREYDPMLMEALIRQKQSNLHGIPQTLGFTEEITPSGTVAEEVIDENSIPQNFRTRMNNSFFERPTLSNASSPANYFNQGLGGVKGIKEKMGQGWDFAQQLPGMAMSALSGIPGIGALMGMLPKTSPEQKAMMELYNSEDYQNVLNQIPGMANYNPVYGMGAGYGLDRAIGKRLRTINKTLGRMTPEQLAKTSLKKRKQKLEELLALEKSKDLARTGASGRRPGSGGPATHQDTAAAGGYSPGQAGAGTGGYSYDRGGRQGYGYGLKDGGRVGYGNGGLATLFTRRG